MNEGKKRIILQKYRLNGESKLLAGSLNWCHAENATDCFLSVVYLGRQSLKFWNSEFPLPYMDYFM